MKNPLIVVCLLISVTLISQGKEVKLELEKKEVFSTLYDLKDNGILIATYKQGNYPDYETILTAYDNELNVTWQKKDLSIHPTDIDVSNNGNGVYGALAYVNGIAISKYDLYNFANTDSDKSVAIKFKNFGRSGVNNNDFMNINTGIKSKTDIQYNIDYYSTDLEVESNSFTIPKPPYKKYGSWNRLSFKDDMVFYQKNFIDFGKENKEKEHKIKLDYIVVDKRKKIMNKELIATHETSEHYSSRTINKYPNNLKYYRNHLNGDNYLIYLNKSENGFYFDCFNNDGVFKWSIEKVFNSQKALKNLYKSSSFNIKVLDSGLIGLDFKNNNTKSTSRYFINDDGETLEEKIILYDEKISLIDDFIINYNRGKMAKKIIEKSQELEKKREMDKARYSFLLKEKYDILLVYINGEINIIKFEK
jgi:hypothetical protein